jgi:antitoxin ParD1/3/4
MPTIERLTVTMPTELAALIKAAVQEGDYASSSEVIREALRDWQVKRSLKLGEPEALRADIDEGMADLTVGRATGFDMDRTHERGRKLLAGCSPSA